jgi:fructose-bisphosphate aldolase class II
MKYILEDANKNNYGVIAANVINLELARGIITAAIEENAPVIINIGQGQMHSHGDGEIMSQMIRTIAGKTHIPVALNLDHGSIYERITHAFRHGFSSIMIDASQYPYEENVIITKDIVKLAHSQGITVEAELGHVGQANEGDNNNKSLYTDPKDAFRFVQETQVDALAVAVGTAHGKYPKGLKPKLNFDIIKEIKNATKMPLVLHGGSDSGEENIRKAVECGINKINVCTDTFNGCRDFLSKRLRENPEIDFLTLMIELENAAKEAIRPYIRMSGSCGKARNFAYYEPKINNGMIIIPGE